VPRYFSEPPLHLHAAKGSRGGSIRREVSRADFSRWGAAGWALRADGGLPGGMSARLLFGVDLEPETRDRIDLEVGEDERVLVLLVKVTSRSACSPGRAGRARGGPAPASLPLRSEGFTSVSASRWAPRRSSEQDVLDVDDAEPTHSSFSRTPPLSELA